MRDVLIKVKPQVEEPMNNPLYKSPPQPYYGGPEQSKLTALSQCDLWDGLKNYYKDQGINAWKVVPYGATNTPSIAHACAQAALHYFKDLINNGLATIEHPFHIVELGAGTGQFGFFMMMQLEKLQARLEMQELKIRYIMTDMAEKNIQFWESHKALAPYISSGKLDFAKYVFGNDEDLTLSVSGESISPLPNPPVILANYFFDSIPQDLFQINDGQLLAGLVPKTAFYPQHDPISNALTTLKDMGRKPVYQKTSGPFYQEPAFNDILEELKLEDHQSFILFPVNALRGIEKLAKRLNERYLLIANDKGFESGRRRHRRTEPSIALHGPAFSFTVDFHLMGCYYKRRGGDSFHQSGSLGVATSAFLAGNKMEELPQTRQAMHIFFNTFSPGDLFNLSWHLFQNRLSCSAETLVSYLNMTHWDPEIFNQHFDLILSLVKQSQDAITDDLLAGLPKIVDQYYHTPLSVDLFANIGALYQAVKQYEQAIPHFQKSIELFGPEDFKFYNLGVCHYFIGSYETALDMFVKVLELNPDDIMVKGWMVQIRDMGKTPQLT